MPCIVLIENYTWRGRLRLYYAQEPEHLSLQQQHDEPRNRSNLCNYCEVSWQHLQKASFSDFQSLSTTQSFCSLIATYRFLPPDQQQFSWMFTQDPSSLSSSFLKYLQTQVQMCSVPPDRKIMKSTMKTITQKKKIAWERTRKKSRRKKEEKETDDRAIQVEKDEEDFQNEDDRKVFTTPGQDYDFSPVSPPTTMPYTMRGTLFHAHHLDQDYSIRDGLSTFIIRHTSSAAKHRKQDSCTGFFSYTRHCTGLFSCASPWAGFFRYTSPWTGFFSHISQCT